MDKKTGFIIAGIVAAFAVLVGVSLWQKSIPNDKEVDYAKYQLEPIKQLAENNNYNDLDLHKIIPASEASGEFGENINGKSDAPVVIYEYADYQCSYCAQMNILLNKIVEDYDGKVAVVFRSYILPYHDESGVAAASAADAAAAQGYWKEYKDLLFANQSSWAYLTGSKLMQELEGYFEKVSNGKGDLAKFKEDMRSEQVAKKLAFDYGIGDKLDIGGTPWLYLDGEWISNERNDGSNNGLSATEYSTRIRGLIDKKLEKA